METDAPGMFHFCRNSGMVSLKASMPARDGPVVWISFVVVVVGLVVAGVGVLVAVALSVSVAGVSMFVLLAAHPASPTMEVLNAARNLRRDPRFIGDGWRGYLLVVLREPVHKECYHFT
jgi:hypothetical protein